MASLAREGAWDYLVIESTGISEPLPVAQTFVLEMPDEHAHEAGEEHVHETNPLLKVARLDTMVTVVDAPWGTSAFAGTCASDAAWGGSRTFGGKIIIE